MKYLHNQLTRPLLQQRVASSGCVTLVLALFRLRCVWPIELDADLKPVVDAAWKAGAKAVLDNSADDRSAFLQRLAAVVKTALASHKTDLNRCRLLAIELCCLTTEGFIYQFYGCFMLPDPMFTHFAH